MGRFGSGGDRRSIDRSGGALAGEKLRRGDAFLIGGWRGLVVVAVVVGWGLTFVGYDHAGGGSDERVEEDPEDERDLIRPTIRRIDTAQSTS